MKIVHPAFPDVVKDVKNPSEWAKAGWKVKPYPRPRPRPRPVAEDN